MPYTYNKLKGRIVEKYGSQCRFAEIVGLSENTVSKKLTGAVGFSQEDIEKWSKLLSIDISEYGAYFFTKKV